MATTATITARRPSMVATDGRTTGLAATWDLSTSATKMSPCPSKSKVSSSEDGQTEDGQTEHGVSFLFLFIPLTLYIST